MGWSSSALRFAIQRRPSAHRDRHRHLRLPGPPSPSNRTSPPSPGWCHGRRWGSEFPSAPHRRAPRDRRGSSPPPQTRPGPRPWASATRRSCRSRPSAFPVNRTGTRENPGCGALAQAGDAPGTRAERRRGEFHEGCTSSCRNRAGRTDSRWRSSSSTGWCSGGQPAAPTPRAIPGETGGAARPARRPAQPPPAPPALAPPRFVRDSTVRKWF